MKTQLDCDNVNDNAVAGQEHSCFHFEHLSPCKFVWSLSKTFCIFPNVFMAASVHSFQSYEMSYVLKDSCHDNYKKM